MSGARRNVLRMTMLASPLADTAAPAERVETVYQPREPFDLLQTVGVFRRGVGDPTMFVREGRVWRALATPLGVGTIVLRQVRGDVWAAAWGPGAEWLIANVPRLCGADDDVSDFNETLHPLVSRAHHENPGLRIGATDAVPDAIVSAIIEQKVTGMQAFGAWKWLVRRHGTRAPGPTPIPLFAAPTLDEWRRIPSWDWHRAGVEPPQSKTIVAAARRGDSLVNALTTARSGAERDTVLQSLTGVGAWTAAEVRIRAFGDPDAVSVGDFHLAHQVGYALTGKRTDDDGMLELLEPWSGQRQRVIRLIYRSGAIEPRRAPRLHPEDHRSR